MELKYLDTFLISCQFLYSKAHKKCFSQKKIISIPAVEKNIYYIY